MIPYGHQSIDHDDIKAVTAVLRSDWLTQGPTVAKFEQALVKYCGTSYTVAVSSGTAALHMAYLAAGLKRGDEVITTPNTFVATANMMLVVGAKPVFGDIRADTYNLDESKIEALITNKTKAIVPVHFAGQPVELTKIKKIARRHKLIVIEDACHALGAKYQRDKIGSCRYADMAVFSFHPVKSITTGEGGAIVTNNKTYYERLRLLRSHGIHKDAQGKNVMTALGYNYRMTDIQAALGLSQLQKLDRFIKQRQQIVKWYQTTLSGVTEIILPLEKNDNYSAWHLYVIKVRNGNIRDRLAAYLKQRGVAVNWHYPAVYNQSYYRQHGYRGVRLPVMEQYQRTCLTLPCYPQLTRRDLKYITQAIKAFFSQEAKI